MQIKPTGTGQTAGTGAERTRETHEKAPAGSENRVAPQEGGGCHVGVTFTVVPPNHRLTLNRLFGEDEAH